MLFRSMGNLVGVVASIKAVEEPIRAVTHIQKTAPAPPAEIAATTPTRLPIPTRVAVETIKVWMTESALCSSSFFSKQLYHRFIKKKTLYMEDIEEDLLTTFIDILKKNPARKNVMYFFPYSLPFPALYAGAASVDRKSVV